MISATKKDSYQVIEFEKIILGQEFELSHEITQGDVNTFATLTGDYNPLHVNEDFAKRTDFRKPVVHGMLSASFISTIIGMFIPGPGALWTSQTIEFLKPSFIGDKITVKATVTQKSESTRFLKLKIQVTNQHGHDVITGESLVKLLKIAKEEEMHNNSEKKTILVTGGSKGIGAAVAKKLAFEGNNIALIYNTSKASADLLISEIMEAGGSATAFKANLEQEENISQLIKQVKEKYGSIYGFVHCASPNPTPQKIMSLDWNDFGNHLNIQLKSAYLIMKGIVPDMVTLGEGSAVFISSIFAEGTPPTQQAPYVTTKAALSALGRAFAVELGPDNIRVNMVSPGMTETEMIASIPDKTKMLTRMQTPLRRLAKADEIAATVSFLMSSNAKHITGENIKICGGISM